MRVRFMIAAVLVLGAVVARAEIGPDAIVGQWFTSEKDARIEIAKTDGVYVGKIVWLKEPVYPPGDAEAGKPSRDRNNPNVSKRNQPMVGLTLLSNFRYVGDNMWKGTIYNPENGKTYKANLSIAKDGTLKVRGYLGVSLLGGTTRWTRYTESGAPR